MYECSSIFTDRIKVDNSNVLYQVSDLEILYFIIR